MSDIIFIAAEWGKEQKDGGWYVSERIHGANDTTVWGPMAEHFVEPLIAERRRYFQEMADRGIASMRPIVVNVCEGEPQLIAVFPDAPEAQSLT